MHEGWMYFLISTLICLIIQSFFSMMEMATVSFNRVRLQYYVSHDNVRAKWLSALLNNPSRLFGTTLIGVNTAMQFGSEFARQFYSSLNLSPDWAPLTQVFIVLIFAELSPMFAARRHAEHVAMLGIPLLYFASIVLRPAIWLLNGIVRFFSLLVGVSSARQTFLSRDELQKAIEARGEESNIDPILENIFTLKTKTAKEMMEPMSTITTIPEDSSIQDVRLQLEKDFLPFMPVHAKNQRNIVGVLYPRDLLRYSSAAKVKEHIRPPWFIEEKTTALQVLKQFKRNSQSLAIVLNKVGMAIGVITLDAVVDEIFGTDDEWVSITEYLPSKHKVVLDRTFPGDTKVSVIHSQFNIELPVDESFTIEEVMEEKLGHSLEEGSRVHIGNYYLTVDDISMLGASSITITTRS